MMNQKTQKLLDGFINRPTSSLLLIGTESDGSEECIAYLCSQLLGKGMVNQRVELQPEKGKQIGVEEVRAFKQSLQTKVHAQQNIARVGVVRQLDSATPESQNALLKLLEEPVEQTVILMQAESKERLLETITSRCQIIPILPLSEEQVVYLATQYGKSKTEAQKTALLTGGAAHLIEILLKDEGQDMLDQLETAKQYLRQSPFERLARMKEFDSSQELRQLIRSLLVVAAAGLHHGNRTQVQKWQNIIKELRACLDLTERNVLVKAIYLRLCVGI